MFIFGDKHVAIARSGIMIATLFLVNIPGIASAECPQPIMMELIKNQYPPDEIFRICQGYADKDRCCCQFTTMEKKSTRFSTRTTRERKIKREITESPDGLSRSMSKTWSVGSSQPALSSENWVEKQNEFRWIKSNKCGGVSEPTEPSMKRRKIVSQCVAAHTCGQ
jgi:hypothetical protein